MNEPAPMTSTEHRMSHPVFVSYATADRKQAFSVCEAIERRGTKCWMSSRDVEPGDNYQEAIVCSIRTARAMVLVFSEAANNSDEIKKELSLASRYHVPVLALRIEDVEPSDAFAYELSTRQWIDAFDGWDRSIDSLVRRIAGMSGSGSPMHGPAPVRRRTQFVSRRQLMIAAACLLLLVIAASAWWWLRPTPAAAHSMVVRLTGFQRLSADLPATMPDALRDEIIAAFGDQGVVGVSTASGPPAGSAPAYALGGTIRRDGAQIRVIARLTNERSGATLWSDSYNYDADQVSRVPRRVAVDAGNMIRCGLYGASTYRKPLPDAVMSNYMQYCHTYIFLTEPGKGLDAARRVVAAAPDFSSGWSAITAAIVQNVAASSGSRREELRREGLEAADKAVALDPTNSEAFAQKSLLIDPADYVSQEALLKKAVAARPLDCGCEHFLYGIMLQNVGRFADSIGEFRRATDMLALDGNSQFALGDALAVTGKAEEGKLHLDASIDLVSDPTFADTIAMIEATETGDYAAGIRALHNPKLQLPAAQRAALLAGFEAMASNNEASKTRAVQVLGALPDEQKDFFVMRLLGALGANREALQAFVNGIGSRFDWQALLWYPSMRGVLNEPAFPALAERLGLMKYWRATNTGPDVCSTTQPPPFCRMI